MRDGISPPTPDRRPDGLTLPPLTVHAPAPSRLVPGRPRPAHRRHDGPAPPHHRHPVRHPAMTAVEACVRHPHTPRSTHRPPLRFRPRPKGASLPDPGPPARPPPAFYLEGLAKKKFNGSAFLGRTAEAKEHGGCQEWSNRSSFRLPRSWASLPPRGKMGSTPWDASPAPYPAGGGTLEAPPWTPGGRIPSGRRGIRACASPRCSWISSPRRLAQAIPPPSLSTASKGSSSCGRTDCNPSRSG